MKNKISAVVITKNEQENIESCLKSLEFTDEVIVVDDFSEDETLARVKDLEFKGKEIKIFKRRLNGDFAGQRNFALEKAGNEWVLFIDADEIITEELRKEIITLQVNNSAEKSAAFYIKRRDYFWEKEIKYGETAGVRNKGLMRLVKKGTGRWWGRVHEEYKLNNSTLNTEHLTNYINHYPHQTVKEFLQKINFYSTMRAKELLRKGKRTNILEIIFFPLGKFIYTYLLKLGFLDGAEGFVYSFFMSFHSFLVRAKLYQYTNIDRQK